MSLLNIANKYIFYELFFYIPVKRRLSIVANSKAYYNKLEYLPITKNIYDKISQYINNKIDKNFENHNYKENRIKIISSDLLDDIFWDIAIKFEKNLSENFLELINEILFEELESKNIYLAKNNSNNIQVDYYKNLQRFNYHNNIINFDDSFCKILTNELISIIYNNKKIFGVIIKINKIDIKNLNLLNQVFNNIHFLKLDFSFFFNNFNDSEINQIFFFLNEFVKNNTIEIFYFKDNTERTLNFIQNFQKFTNNLNELNQFYMKKYFQNSQSNKVIQEAFQNDNKEILSILEDPNLLLKNYLININNKIKLLNLNVSNPCSIDGNPGDGSFCLLATESKDFSIISKFQNLEELVLLYDWPADYYFGFDKNKSLIKALNSIKGLKNVIFKENDYLLEALSEIKVENAAFINNKTFDSEISIYQIKIILTEMLNNIKNIEIKIKDKCSYKNKILKYQIFEGEINKFFDCACKDAPGFKNIEELFIKIMYENMDYYASKEINNCENFENIILHCCKQNNHLKKINIDYLSYDLCEILKILCNYCKFNNTLKNIELVGSAEKKNINEILDYILTIKNQKVDIITNISDDNINTIICNSEYIKKGKLSYENISMTLSLNVVVKVIKIK